MGRTDDQQRYDVDFYNQNLMGRTDDQQRYLEDIQELEAQIINTTSNALKEILKNRLDNLKENDAYMESIGNTKQAIFYILETNGYKGAKYIIDHYENYKGLDTSTLLEISKIFINNNDFSYLKKIIESKEYNTDVDYLNKLKEAFSNITTANNKEAKDCLDLVDYYIEYKSHHEYQLKLLNDFEIKKETNDNIEKKILNYLKKSFRNEEIYDFEKIYNTDTENGRLPDYYRTYYGIKEEYIKQLNIELEEIKGYCTKKNIILSYEQIMSIIDPLYEQIQEDSQPFKAISGLIKGHFPKTQNRKREQHNEYLKQKNKKLEESRTNFKEFINQLEKLLNDNVMYIDNTVKFRIQSMIENAKTEKFNDSDKYDKRLEKLREVYADLRNHIHYNKKIHELEQFISNPDTTYQNLLDKYLYDSQFSDYLEKILRPVLSSFEIKKGEIIDSKSLVELFEILSADESIKISKHIDKHCKKNGAVVIDIKGEKAKRYDISEYIRYFIKDENPINENEIQDNQVKITYSCSDTIEGIKNAILDYNKRRKTRFKAQNYTISESDIVCEGTTKLEVNIGGRYPLLSIFKDNDKLYLTLKGELYEYYKKKQKLKPKLPHNDEPFYYRY